MSCSCSNANCQGSAHPGRMKYYRESCRVDECEDDSSNCDSAHRLNGRGAPNNDIFVRSQENPNEVTYVREKGDCGNPRRVPDASPCNEFSAPGMPCCRRCHFRICNCGPCRGCRVYEYVNSVSKNFAPKHSTGYHESLAARMSGGSACPSGSAWRGGQNFGQQSETCSNNNASGMEGQKDNCAPTPDKDDWRHDCKRRSNKDRWEREKSFLCGGDLISEYRAAYQCTPHCNKRTKKYTCKRIKHLNSDDIKKPPWDNSTKVSLPDPRCGLSLDACEAKLKVINEILRQERLAQQMYARRVRQY